VNVIPVDLGARRYDITVGPDALAALPETLRTRRRIAVVTQERIPAAIVDRVVSALRAAGPAVEVFFMGDGEDAKTLATIDDLCRWFAQWGLLRADAIVAVGGGVVGDTAGFAAATYYRGLDVVQVPTTLLAMVDSAIGGKTGVNLPEGKNLVGAFHQPIAVFADPSVLQTLPEREYKCGLGEIAKYALMRDFTPNLDLLNRRDTDELALVVEQCAEIKAEYVVADEFERTGVRAVLNYGHTLAHALETATGHALLHGEAVAVGLVYAGALAGALERIDSAAVERHVSIVGGLGLPVEAPPGLRADELLPIMARDKKSAGTLTFMLARTTQSGETCIERVDDPDPAAVRKAFGAVGVEA
jgi:5-deoxy-5-amino-3-dehydroquinate synthase